MRNVKKTNKWSPGQNELVIVDGVVKIVAASIVGLTVFIAFL